MRAVSDTHVTAAEAADRPGSASGPSTASSPVATCRPANPPAGATGAYLFDADDVTAAAVKTGKAAA